MSTETITVIVSVAALMLTFAGGFAAVFAWAMRRLDARFDLIDRRFDRVDTRIDRLEDRMGKVEHELVEVKIGIARLEGPPRRLISAGS